MSEQLALFADTDGRAPASSNGHNGRRTMAELGLKKEVGPGRGPERLLRELARRGLGDEHYVGAAALVLALNAEAASRS